ncbi:hypothetical protein CHUAL_012515 [Chamberlinius hualienensis]
MSEGLASLLARLQRELDNPQFFAYPLLVKLEEVSKIKKIYLAYGFLGFLALYLVFGYAAQLVCNLIGFAWPAYQSLKALESSSKDDDTKWLMYWVTFASFSIFEFFADILLNWFPPYFLVKVIFLIWCSLPIEKNGSAVIYNTVIRPFFLRNQEKIDEYVKMGKTKASNAYKNVEALSKEN